MRVRGTLASMGLRPRGWKIAEKAMDAEQHRGDSPRGEHAWGQEKKECELREADSLALRSENETKI